LLFTDYEKAFDNIEGRHLFNILKSRHIPDTLLMATVNVYTQNKIIIKFNNKLSKLVEIIKRVQQRYPRSPRLVNTGVEVSQNTFNIRYLGCELPRVLCVTAESDHVLS
jgi:hypothetical protein